MIVASPFPCHWSGASGGGGGPIVRTSKGEKDSAGASVASLTMTSVSITAGALLIVVASEVGSSGSMSCTFNGTTMASPVAINLPGPSPTGQLKVFQLSVSSATTGSIVLTPSASCALSIAAIQVTGLAHNAADDSVSNNGTVSAPDSGTTATTTQAAEYVQGAALLVDPGLMYSWSGTPTFTTGGQDATQTVGLDTIVATEGYVIASSTGTFDAKVTSTPNEWAMCCVTYK